MSATGVVGLCPPISGRISDSGKITGNLQLDNRISGAVTQTIVNNVPIYTGEYVIDPSFDEQILETNNLMMTDDVTVNAIEVSRTSNPSGGVTIYIGGNING